VQEPCLDFALATRQIHGVWGGTTEEERQRLRRHRAAPRPASHSRQAAQRQQQEHPRNRHAGR